MTVNGKKGQTVAVSSDGSFSAKVGAFLLTAGLNDIEISPQSGKDGQSLVVKKQYYYDIADFEHGISDAAKSFWQQGVSRYCGELSVGGQTLKTNNGFCLRPLDGEDAAEAKVTFDLTKTEKPVRFFHSLIGAGDFGNVNGTVGSSAVYSVVIDGVTAARSRETGMNETDEISAEIPAGAKELTLCVNNSNGSNHADYADYINPRLFLKSEDYTGTEASLFSERTDTELKAKASVSTRLNLKNDFSSVTIAPKKAGEKVFGRLFKFTYSKTRSMQNGALCEVELSPDGQGNYKFTLNDLYGPGEYLFVFDGVTSFSGRQQTFNSYLKPGETARTPLTAVILYDGRDTDRATNLWRRWMIDCNMYKKDGKTNLEPFVAGLPKEVMYQTEDSMIENIELYEKLGVDIDYWWIDAGWYVDGNTRNWTHVGNWTVDTERFPTKLSAVGEACEKAGMRGRIILWFEPERNAFRMNENDFETYGVSKEWLAGYNKEKNTAPGPTNSHIFDLGNKQALTDKYIMRTAYRQSIACQVHLETFDSQTVELLKDCIDEWKGINGYFYGDIYELTKNTVSQNEWYSYSYINDEKEGFAFVFNRGGEYAEKSQKIRLKGLDPNGIYEISFADSEDKITAVGAELMSVGITMTLDENEHGQSVGDSDIIYIKRVSAAVIYGDTDGDGEISVTDALLTLQGSVAKINLTAEQSAAADVDGDGKVTVTDALLILQKSVGKIQSFPVEK